MNLTAADLGIDARNLSKTHRIAEILWSNPRGYNSRDHYPENHEIPQGTHGFVYCLIRDHGKMKTRNTVVYVGISENNSKKATLQKVGFFFIRFPAKFSKNSIGIINS